MSVHSNHYLVFTMNKQFYTLLAATMMAAVVTPVTAQGILEAGSLHGTSSRFANSGRLSAALGKAYSPSLNSRPSTASFDDDDVERCRAAGEKSVQLWNKAKACEKRGESDKALRLYRETLITRWQIWRDRDPAIPQLLIAIGSMEEKVGHLQNAEKCYRDLLKLTAKNYGPGSWELCTPLAKLANVLAAQKKYHEAASNYTLVFELTERKYGTTDTRTKAAAAKVATAIKSEQF